MFKSVNPDDFGYSWTISKEKLEKIELTRAKKKARAQDNKDARDERQGLPFILNCGNPNCAAVLGYVFESVNTEAKAIKDAGWRQFHGGLLLCPRCRAIQEQRIKAEFNRKMWESRQQKGKVYGDGYVDPLG